MIPASSVLLISPDGDPGHASADVALTRLGDALRSLGYGLIRASSTDEGLALVNAQQGVIYQVEGEDAGALKLLSSYADDGTQSHAHAVRLGEGLIGQCALDKRRILISDIPTDAVPIA